MITEKQAKENRNLYRKWMLLRRTAPPDEPRTEMAWAIQKRVCDEIRQALLKMPDNQMVAFIETADPQNLPPYFQPGGAA